MIFTPESFQEICPKGQGTLEELRDALEASLDGDPDGEVEQIFNECRNSKKIREAILQRFEHDPDYAIIGETLYHTEQVEDFATQWIKHLFRVGLMVDPPNEFGGDFITEMVDYMRDLGEDGISDQLTAKAFKAAIEGCD